MKKTIVALFAISLMACGQSATQQTATSVTLDTAKCCVKKDSTKCCKKDTAKCAVVKKDTAKK